MKPSEILTRIARERTFKEQILSGAIQLFANDPLGCQRIRVSYDHWKRQLIWDHHRGSSPYSIKCYWTDHEIQDQIGKVIIDVGFW